MNKECGVLFLHHQPLDNPLVTKHLAAIADLGLTAIPLSFGERPPPPGQTPETYSGYARWRWGHMDHLVYEWWFSEARIDFDRYMVVEYDTWFTLHPKLFYGASYDRDAVAACVMDARQPQATMPAGNTFDYWFKNTPGHQEFRDHGLAHCLRGMMPIVCLFSRRCLSGIAEAFKSNPWCQAPGSPELRFGSLAAVAGFEPESFNGPKGPGIHYQYANPVTPDKPGIWHPVKDAESLREWQKGHGAP
jgi:hypothetical protein